MASFEQFMNLRNKNNRYRAAFEYYESLNSS